MTELNYTLEVTERVLNYTIQTGTPGLSAYADAVINGGFVGTLAEWLASLRGPALTWDDLTPEQILYLKLKYSDLTEEEKLELKGDPLRWQDLTEEQKEEIRGEKGDQGDPGVIVIGDGPRYSGVNAGELGEESYFEGYKYQCVVAGEAAETTWIKWQVQESLPPL